MKAYVEGIDIESRGAVVDFGSHYTLSEQGAAKAIDALTEFLAEREEARKPKLPKKLGAVIRYRRNTGRPGNGVRILTTEGWVLACGAEISKNAVFDFERGELFDILFEGVDNA